MPTKETILDTALRLFNQSGTPAVSTNHIAAGAAISPGNLYYHFHNKEEIIRAILERQIAAYDPVWRLPDGRPPTLEDLHAMIHRHFELLWEYRFFFRELLPLMQRDPALRERYQAMQARRTREIGAVLRGFGAARVLQQPDDPAVLREVLTAAWVISEYWLSFLESSGTPIDADQMQRGAGLVIRVLQPYFADGAPARKRASPAAPARARQSTTHQRKTK
jgi:AcrR family transcriptional regulator